MRLENYVRGVQDQLEATAALGDDRVRDVAASLATAAAPAVRLAVLNAITDAADEITTALMSGPGAPAVRVHLDADEVRVAVTTTETTEPPPPPRGDEGDASARISLRLSEALKAEIEQAATQAGVSVNTWLVRVASTALTPAGPGPHGAGGWGQWGWSGWSGHENRVTGWVNG